MSCSSLPEEPPTYPFLQGENLATTTWDVLTGMSRPKADVLVYDDNGQHQGISCVEYILANGSSVKLVTPDRMAAQEVGGTNYPIYLKILYENQVETLVTQRLMSIHKGQDQLIGTFYNEYSRTWTEIAASQIVVEHGTLPNDEIYFDLKPQSRNLGQVEIDSLVACRPQNSVWNEQGKYQLFRLGDAVCSRNIHAALYDSIRLCQQI